MIASANRSACTADWNTENFGQKPSKGGIPARLNMKTNIAAASPGRLRAKPDSDASVSTARPSPSRICMTTRKQPSVITMYTAM